MNIETITAAHSIDRDLTQLAASLDDGELRERVLAAQSNWRDVAYAISSTVCGVALKNVQEPAKKRGRPRKTEQDDPARTSHHEDSLRASDGGVTNDSAAQL